MRAARAVPAAPELQQARDRAKRNSQVAIQQQAAQHKKRASALRIKIISMGAPGVGKSCLIKRYCEEKFVSKYIGTIGVDYGVKCVRLGSCDVRVNLWDLAGGEEYFEVRNEFYKEAQGCILVYDVNNRASFQALEGWVEESNRHGAQNAVVVVAGNKTDVGRRTVSEREGRAWAEANGFLFFETSAADGERVRAMFAAAFHRVLEALPHTPPDVLDGCSALVSTEYANAAAEGCDCGYQLESTRLRAARLS